MDWFWSPVGIGVLWLVLHSTDYLLTIATSRLSIRKNLTERMQMGGSIELNPLFVKAVEKRQWISWRFILTLVLGAIALPLAVAYFHRGTRAVDTVYADDLSEMVCGALFVTRFAIISIHLQNLTLLRRMIRVPEASIVSVRYDRGTVMVLARARKIELAAFCAIAILVTGRPFFYGGLAATLSLIGLMFYWGRRRAPSTPASAPPASG